MARIRSIKPEFWSDEKLSLLDPLTRLVFLGLVSMADDAGRLVDNVKAIDGMLFPNTDDTCADALDILARLSRVLRYVAPSGQHVIQIVNWDRHQKVDHPNKYVLPAPTDDDFAQAQAAQGVNKSLAQVVTGFRENVARPSRDPRDTTNDQRSTTNDLKRLAPRGLSDDERKVRDHYLARHPKRRTTDQSVRRYVGAMLKHFDADELCRAVDVNADDPWHAERGKHELSYVFRNVEMVSGWLDRKKPVVGSIAPNPNAEAEHVWELCKRYGFHHCTRSTIDGELERAKDAGDIDDPEAFKTTLRKLDVQFLREARSDGAAVASIAKRLVA